MWVILLAKERSKLDIYQVIWLYGLGCLFGYVLETVFYLLKYGNYVNKQGLIVGPFKPIYGAGAILMTFFYHKLNKKNMPNTFIMGVVIGTSFEYLCSFLLEFVFKSYFWDYSTFNYNINGRIYLPYSIVWGIVAIFWVYGLYSLFLKIYNKIKKINYFNYVSAFVGLFFFINTLVTGFVLLRQGHRDKDNFVFKIVDNYYPEHKIKEKFPKFRSIKK